MNLKESYGEFSEITKDAVKVKNNSFIITDFDKLKSRVPELINASKNSLNSSRTICYLILSAAHQKNTYLSSLHNLYKAKGTGKIQQCFSIPVIDCTKYSLKQVQEIIKAQISIRLHLSCFGMKIDDPSINPYLFIIKVLGAALLENYSGPIFLHAGSIKFDYKRFNHDRDMLMDELKDIVKTLINLGFYNLTLDSSEIIEENRSEILEKLLMNLKMVAMATTLWIRNFEPKDINVAVGGVLGFIEDQSDSTTILKEYLKRLLKEGSRLRFNTPGEDVVKIEVISEKKLSIDSLNLMNAMVRNDYKMGGLVLDLGELSNISQINEMAKNDFCELHFKLSDKLRSVSNYASIFSNLVNDDLQNNFDEYILKRKYLPQFNEL